MHVRISVYIYIHLCRDMYIYIYGSMHVCMYLRAYVLLHACMCIWANLYTRVYVRAGVHVHV